MPAKKNKVNMNEDAKIGTNFMVKVNKANNFLNKCALDTKTICKKDGQAITFGKNGHFDMF